jgi:hypothetical protein
MHMPQTTPIRLFARDGKWVVDYGSYAHGYHLTRADAIKTATLAAYVEHRRLVIEPTADTAARTHRETTW